MPGGVAQHEHEWESQVLPRIEVPTRRAKLEERTCRRSCHVRLSRSLDSGFPWSIHLVSRSTEKQHLPFICGVDSSSAQRESFLPLQRLEFTHSTSRHCWRPRPPQRPPSAACNAPFLPFTASEGQVPTSRAVRVGRRTARGGRNQQGTLLLRLFRFSAVVTPAPLADLVI